MFINDIFLYIFFIYYQVVYLCCISLRDRIFILFLLMTWPEYLFLRKILDPSQNQTAIP